MDDFVIGDDFGFSRAHFRSVRRAALCDLDFGIGEALVGLLVSAGVGAETAGFAAPLIVGGLEGAGLGAAGSAITGGDPLTGALTGGLTGGVIGGFGGAGGLFDSATGSVLGGIGSDAVLGAGSGALGAGLTGGDPLHGALAGGLQGGLAGAAGEFFGPGGAGSEIFGGSGGGFFGDGVGTLPSTTNPFGAISSDASNALTYSPSVAPGVEGAAGIAASPLTGGAGTLGGPGAQAFTPPAGAAGSIDLTGNFAGGGGGGSVFSGASTAEALPVGAGAGAGAASSGSGFGELTPEIIQNAGGVVGVDPGNLPTPPIPPAGGAPSGGGFFSGIGDAISDAGKFVSGPTGKLIGTGVSVLGLGNSLLSASNPNPIPGMADIQAVANSLGKTGTGLIQPNAEAAANTANNASSQARVMEDYLTTGTLPPAVQSALDSATDHAVISIKAQYAKRGMPPGSSSEIQDINAVRQNAVIQGGTLAASLFSQGVSLDQLSASIYQNLVGSGTSLANSSVAAQTGLVNARTAQNTGLNSSIAALASSLGGGRTLTVTPSQAQALAA